MHLSNFLWQRWVWNLCLDQLTISTHLPNPCSQAALIWHPWGKLFQFLKDKSESMDPNIGRPTTSERLFRGRVIYQRKKNKSK